MKTQAQYPRHFIMIISLIVITLLGSLPGLSSVQVIDRDEARYAQASQQMYDSGDYVNIRFHDRDRHKKPAGIYWAQAAMLTLFSSPDDRQIWAHRLPSVIAGIIAVLGLYWTGLSLFDRRSAFIAALLLSTSLLFIYESHNAKTDAVLCAASVWVMAAMLRLRQDKYRRVHPRYALILWTALGVAVIVKGPILPAILAVSVITAILWERRLGLSLKWASRLITPLGLCIFGILTLPWFIMIGKETGGAFYGAAIGGDLAPKLAGGQESHFGYPGYYSALVFISFWPAALFFLAALSYGFRALRGQIDGAITAADARWLLCWIIPFWIILEAVPTKLPHYNLPLFPAAALLMAGAISAIESLGFFRKTRKIGAVLFFAITLVLIFVIAGADAFYGADAIWVYGLGIIMALSALLTTIFTIKGKMRPALIGLIVTSLGLSVPTYGLIMPNLTEIRLAPRIMEQLKVMNIALPREGGPVIRSPHFTEPSLIYYLGSNVLLGESADNLAAYPHMSGQVWIIDMKQKDSAKRLIWLKATAEYNQLCLKDYKEVTGLNYSKGDEVDLALLSVTACQ